MLRPRDAGGIYAHPRPEFARLEHSGALHISAARAHDALPRALNVAVVAANRHRGALELTDRPAQVQFIRRDVARLDLQRHRTELGTGWVTTPEQTVLDLAARPDPGAVPDATAWYDRAASRDLYVLWALAEHGHITIGTAQLFAQHGPTNRPPSPNLFRNPPPEDRWQRDLGRPAPPHDHRRGRGRGRAHHRP